MQINCEAKNSEVPAKEFEAISSYAGITDQ
jgi:hypothetical protein